jgi:hypothetical protein
MLEARFGLEPGLVGQYQILSSDQVRTALDVGRTVVRSDTSALRPKLAEFKAAGDDVESARRWLQELNIRGRVMVIWVPDLVGLEIEYGKFADYFDDFWYPSSDDVWVITEDGAQVLELNHEEEFALFQRVDVD